MNIKIITVNYGNTTPTELLLDSIYSCKDSLKISISIADNCSSIKSLQELNILKDKSKLNIDIFPNEKNLFYWPAAKKIITSLYDVNKTIPDWTLICNNDITFIDEFVDDDFCLEHDLFVTVKKTTNTGGQVEKSYSAKEVKTELLNGLTNIGNPIIKVIDSNYNNSGQLVLKHKFCGKNLRKDYAMETLKNIYSLIESRMFNQNH